MQVRPLRQITGESEFNELFIDGARIPDENVLGGEGNGWKVALTTLMNERAGLAFFLQVRLRQMLDRLIAEAAAARPARRSGDRRPARRAAPQGRDPAADRLSRADRDREVRPAGPGGLADQVDVVRDQPAAHPVRRRPAGTRGAAPPAAAGPTSCCAPAATRSRAAPPRCSRTSSPSACSASPRPVRRTDMDFDLTEDQREIKNVARELLAARSPFAKVREAAEAAAYDDALWREIVELGWPGIAVAEEHGGQGLGAVELAVLLEELGYACAATPFLATAVAAAVIQAARHRRAARRWLPGLVSGELRAGLGAAGARRRRRTARTWWSCSRTTARACWPAGGRDRAAGGDRPHAPLCHGARRGRAAGRRCRRPGPRGDRRRGRRACASARWR